MHNLLSRSLYLLPLFAPAFLTAHELTDLSEQDYLAEEPIGFASATRIKQDLRDVPAAITIIDREMIEASSAINVIELLRLVPGFQVGSIDGTESTATYHGLSSQHNTRLQILIDGRSVYQSTFGGALWYSLPITLDEIETIEVIRGPNAASYGANAFSAVVNIKTFDSRDNQGSSLTFLGGDRDTKRTTLSHSDSLGELSYRIIAELESNTGYQDTFQDYWYTCNTTGCEKDRPMYDDHFHRQLSLRTDNTGDNGALHSVQVGFRDLKFGGGYENYADLAPFDKKVKSHFQNYTYSINEGLLKSRRFQLYHNYVDYDAQLYDGSGVFLTLDWSFRDERFDVEYQENQIWSPKLQTVWGAGLRYDISESIGWLEEDKHERFSARLFGHAEWKTTDSVTLNAGALVETHEHIGDYFSPRFALNYHVNDKHTLRSSWSRAYRMPSLYAEYADQSIVSAVNPSIVAEIQTHGQYDIEPELITSFEIGYLGAFFDKKLEFDLRLAREKITNIIDRVKTGVRWSDKDPRFKFVNFGVFETDSAELQLSYKPTKQAFVKFNASYTNAKGYTANVVTLNGQPTGKINYNMSDHVPLLTTSALFSYRFPNNFRSSIQYSFVETYETEGDGDTLENLESIDLKLAKTFDLDGSNIDVSGIVRNVADNLYQDFSDDNLVGLEAYLQIKLEMD